MQENRKKKKQEETNEHGRSNRHHNRRGLRAVNLPGDLLLEQGERRMTGIEMRKEVADYLTTQMEERKNAGITKVPMFDARDVLQAYRAGLLNGLRRHSHDYLVKTADLKKRYEKQKEINKELVDENEKLKKDSEENQDLATIAYMQGATRKQYKLT